MIAKVTAPDLAQDVIGAEALINRHQEYQQEIKARGDSFTNFYDKGIDLIGKVCSVYTSLYYVI